MSCPWKTIAEPVATHRGGSDAWGEDPIPHSQPVRYSFTTMSQRGMMLKCAARHGHEEIVVGSLIASSPAKAGWRAKSTAATSMNQPNYEIHYYTVGDHLSGGLRVSGL